MNFIYKIFLLYGFVANSISANPQPKTGLCDQDKRFIAKLADAIIQAGERIPFFYFGKYRPMIAVEDASIQLFWHAENEFRPAFLEFLRTGRKKYPLTLVGQPYLKIYLLFWDKFKSEGQNAFWKIREYFKNKKVIKFLYSCLQQPDLYQIYLAEWTEMQEILPQQA